MNKTTRKSAERTPSKLPIATEHGDSREARDSKIEELTLSNGIPTLLCDYDAPVGAIYWWNRTGSADERPAEAGFAHFLEHMLFKDAAAKETGKASTGQLARQIESLGGDINAYTSFDQTVYHVTCAETFFEKVLEHFSLMAKPQRFLKSDFLREREVILEELRKNEDAPGRMLFQKLFAATFGRHPYGRPVIGFTRTLNAASVGQLEAFYKRRYVASQMGLVIVAPFSRSPGRRERVLKLLEKRFGQAVHRAPKTADARGAATRALQTRRTPVAEFTAKPAAVTMPFDVQTPSIAVSFRVPHLLHDDVIAIDVLSGVLGMGELSRLYQRLFQNESLVTEVSAGLYCPSANEGDPGMFYLQADVPTLNGVDAAIKALFVEVERIKTEGPTDDELKRIRVHAESERSYSTQTADGIASRIGHLRFTMNDLAYDQTYLARVKRVSAADVQAAAQKYLVTARMSVAAMVPKKTEESVAALAKNCAERCVALGAELLSPAPAPIQSTKTSCARRDSRADSRADSRKDVKQWQTGDGIRVIHRYRPNSSVFSVQAAALGGSRLEGVPGQSQTMAQVWARGTKSKSVQQIAAEIEGRAASLDGFSGRNSIGMQLTGLAADREALLGVMREVMVEPGFFETEFNHVMRVNEDGLKGLEDHSGQLCSKLFLETLFEKHPYGRLTTGSLESLAQLRLDQLREVHRQWVTAPRLVIAASGAITEAELMASVTELGRALAGHSMSGAPAQVASPEAESALKAPRWVESLKAREQAHIMIGGLGSKIGSPDRFALRIMQNILGGQSGRLFIELREKQSLAYSVSPISFEGLEPGYIGTYIACAPTKRDQAIAGIRKVLKNLARKGPSEAELSRAKNYYLGQRAMELQSDSALAGHHVLELLYGLPALTDAEVLKAVQSVTAKQVRELCARYLVDPHQVTALVG